MSWYLPEAKIDKPSKFKDMLTILNLRGDALNHPNKLAFLKKHSDMLVILTDSIDHIHQAKFDKEKDPISIILSP